METITFALLALPIAVMVWFLISSRGTPIMVFILIFIALFFVGPLMFNVVETQNNMIIDVINTTMGNRTHLTERVTITPETTKPIVQVTITPETTKPIVQGPNITEIGTSYYNWSFGDGPVYVANYSTTNTSGWLYISPVDRSGWSNASTPPPTPTNEIKTETPTPQEKSVKEFVGGLPWWIHIVITVITAIFLGMMHICRPRNALIFASIMDITMAQVGLLPQLDMMTTAGLLLGAFSVRVIAGYDWNPEANTATQQETPRRQEQNLSQELDNLAREPQELAPTQEPEEERVVEDITNRETNRWGKIEP